MNSFSRHLLPLTIFLTYLLPLSLPAQQKAYVKFKPYTLCADRNDPRNTVADLKFTVTLDGKNVGPVGEYFPAGSYTLSIRAAPRYGAETVKGTYIIRKIEWIKCGADVKGPATPLASRNVQSTEASMPVTIANLAKDDYCYEAVIHVDKCGDASAEKEAAIKLVTITTQKYKNEQVPTDKAAVFIGDEKINVAADGTGFIKRPVKKQIIRIEWQGDGKGNPVSVSVLNSKTNKITTLARVPNRPKNVHEYPLDLSQHAGTGNLYDYEIRINMLYEPGGAPMEVRVLGFQPGVEVHKAGTPADEWYPLTSDMMLQQGDEISCDPDGAVKLQFGENSTVVVRNTTQLKIASFFTEGGVVHTELLLKMGQVAAEVYKSDAVKSDFVIKTTAGDGSVRGTRFSMLHDPATITTAIKVEEGIVAFRPEKAPASGVTLKTGQQVTMEGNRMGRILPFTDKIDFLIKRNPVIPAKEGDLSGTWLVTQGNYTGRLTIRQDGPDITGSMAWDNHKKGNIEYFTFFEGIVIFILAYDGDLRGNYNGQLDSTGRKMTGECLTDKSKAEKWSAIRQ